MTLGCEAWRGRKDTLVLIPEHFPLTTAEKWRPSVRLEILLKRSESRAADAHSVY